MARKEVITEINRATTICRKNPGAAVKLLNGARQKYWRNKRNPAERFLVMLGLTFPDFSSQTAAVYRVLGDGFVKRFEHEPTIRCYSMALTHHPDQPDLAIDLGMACMKTDNYELGYFTGYLANKEKPGSGDMYYKYFGKKYLPPWAPTSN
jgi:hypothetical protein